MTQLPPPRRLENSKFYNNTEPKTLKNKFATILSNNSIINLDFLVGYLRISGFKHLYELIQNRLESFERIRILVGLSVDSAIAQLTQAGIESDTAKAARFLEIFHNNQVQNIQDDAYQDDDDTIDQSIQMLIDALKAGKIQMRIVKDKNVHAKFYVFSQNPLPDHTSSTPSCSYTGSLIIGSSNLSDNGLVSQYEFNAELNQSADIETALYEFNQLWEKSIEISHSDIEKIKDNTFLKTLTPREIYYKMLIEHFGIDKIKVDKDIETLFPEGYKALEYQVYAIKDGISKLENHNGFFLSDVVGLGKTLIATIIAQKLEISGKLRGKILIVCPPALRANWEHHFNQVGVNRHVTIQTHDTLGKINNPQDYGLIIVDESHRFKSSSADRYKALEKICENKTRYPDKKVILLSATPQTNSPEDLENQIYLFTDPRNSRIGKIPSLEKFFKEIKSDYKKIKEELKELDAKKDTKANQEAKAKAKEKLRRISNRMRDEVLNFIMIRRTRNDIKKLYGDDLQSQGIAFPTTPTPTPLEYELKEQARHLSEETIKLLDLKSNDIGAYGYHRYLVYPNLTPQGQQAYRDEMDTNKDGEFYERTAQRLTGLMKSLLFKRFESSIHSFKETLNRQIQALETLAQMLESQKVRLPIKNFNNLEAYYEAIESNDEEFFEDNEKNLVELDTKDFKPDYLEKIKSDTEILRELLNQWKEIKEDSKLEKLVAQLHLSLNRKIIGEKNAKVIIFTEAQTTARYLGKKLKELLPDYGILQVDSENRKSNEAKIKANFDASHPHEDWEHDIQILISTDTLAEGVNMHRCDTLINYDAPWNATLLMQRAGRINRVGTKHQQIFVYNFQPSNIGEEALNFGKQVYQKLQSFHFTLGEDGAIYTPDEEVGTQGLYQATTTNEDYNPETPFLADILELQKNAPKEFDRIASLPSKIRSSMIGEGDSFFYLKQPITETHHQNQTIEYLGEYFYQVSGKQDSREVRRVEFFSMASHLKSHLQSTPTLLSSKTHYSDASKVFSHHKNELEEHTQNKERQLSNDAKDAKLVINDTNQLTPEQKTLLNIAIDRGSLSDKEEKQIKNGKADFQKILEKIQDSIHPDESTPNTRSKIKIQYAAPALQLSYTTQKD